MEIKYLIFLPGDVQTDPRKKTTRSMSQGDMLGPEEIQEALLAVQAGQRHQQQHPQQQQQHRGRQQQHPKSHDSPGRKRVPGENYSKLTIRKKAGTIAV